MTLMLEFLGDQSRHAEYTSPAKMQNVSEDTSTESTTTPVDNSTNATSIYLATWGSLVSLNYTLPGLIIVAVVLFIVIIATAFGNFLVVLALFKYRSLRTISNYLIGNLALSDFLLATTILPLSTFNECLGHWIFGQALCNAWLIMDVLYCTASIWNILVIAFDRFTATLYPLWYREKRSAKKAAVYIALVWLISCAICLPPVLGWNDLQQNYRYDEEQRVHMCVLFETPSYVLYSASGSFYIPFFMTFFFYMAIFIALRGRMQKSRRSAMKEKARNNPSSTGGAGDHLQPPDKRSGGAGSGGGAAHKKPRSKAKRLEKEYRLELVNVDDKKDSIVADENSSKSLFGSDSEREKSVSDVEQEGGAGGTEVEEVSAVVGGGGSGYTTGGGQETAVPTNGFSSLVSSALLPLRPANASGINREQGSEVACCVGSTAGSGVASGHVNLHKHGVMPSLASTGAINPPHHDHPLGPPSKTQPTRATAGVTAAKVPPVKVPAKAAAVKASKLHRRYEQREMRATIRMAIIIAFFCGMWVGFFTLYVIHSWCSGCYISRELDAFFFWLGYSNSSINPILYTIFNEDFRKAFMQIVGCHVGGKAPRKVKR